MTQEADPTKFAVYLTPQGRVKKGIVRAHVSIDGNLAYVRRKTENHQADILPAANIFDTKEAAEAYLAGTGIIQWVVGMVERGGGYLVPVMFRARVLYYEYWGRYRLEHSTVVKAIGREIKTDSYKRCFFKTKKEAEKKFSELWREQFKNVDTHFKQFGEHLAVLKKYKPRSRKAKP